MGKLEEESRKSSRKTRLQEAILVTLISGGRMGSEQLVKQVIDNLLGTDFAITSPRRSEIVRSTASRLNQKGLVVFKDHHYSLTPAGEKMLKKWQMSRYQIKQPRKWDKKWRVIIFDIPEKKKKIRERVRQILLAANFQRLQDSVWVHPYDCEDIIGLMKTDLSIGKHLLYLIVDQIENDRFLRMDFGLVE